MSRIRYGHLLNFCDPNGNDNRAVSGHLCSYSPDFSRLFSVLPSFVFHISLPLRLDPPTKAAAADGLVNKTSSIRVKLSLILSLYFTRSFIAISGQLFTIFWDSLLSLSTTAERKEYFEQVKVYGFILFYGQILTRAILDRLVHPGLLLMHEGQSYRIQHAKMQ